MAHARRRAYALALTLAATVLAAAPASAQRLPALHVTSLGMHADRLTVRPGEAFHVTVRVVVQERGAQIAPILILPSLDNLDDLGDERRSVAVPNGTEFVEVLTLAARAPGEATLTPAYLDAIDARNGRPSRFSSQPLHIHVTGDAAAGTHFTVLHPLRFLWNLLAGALVFIAFGAAFLALAVLLVRRRRRQPRRAAQVHTGVVLQPAPPPPPPDPLAGVRRALDAFRSAPSDASRVALRRELFVLAGVPAGATLTDVLARNPPAPLRAALLAAEHAVFCRPDDRMEADRRLLDSAAAVLDRGREHAWTS